MLSVTEALDLVSQHSRALPAVRLATSDALGRILAEDVHSDLDSPPYAKSLVDGYAVVASDLASGAARLEIIEEVVAGRVPTRAIAAGKTTRIMTGAPVPPGADAVVMLERTQSIESDNGGLGSVSIEDRACTAGRNILPQGQAMRRGDLVLKAGVTVGPAEIGLLAEVGRDKVQVVPAPRVAILSTGDELVPPSVTPGPGQIRNSNGLMLYASVERSGAVACDLGIGRDDANLLRGLIELGLSNHVLVISGGVSAGKLDLVPGVLAEAGVQQVFHKVQLKPGKPIWFGRLPDAKGDKLVFGLPGNPVSSFVCFELFVRPAINRLAGRADWAAQEIQACLESPFRHRGDRPTFHPARLNRNVTPPTVSVVEWHGSADLRGLTRANALAYFAAGDRDYEAGDLVPARLL